MVHNQCPDQSVLEQLLNDRLAQLERDFVSLHVQTCASCQATLDQMAGDLRTLVQDREPELTFSEEGDDPLVRRLVQRLPAFNLIQTPAQTATETSPPGDSGPSVPGYEILGELGRGGMGVIYEARHLGLNRKVALKMILTGAHASAQELSRFRREAEAVARLQHPNIVQIFDIGESAGLPYLSMELVEGGSLAQAVSSGQWPATNPQTPRRAAQLLALLADAVHYAHERGIVHRDLKPANILLKKDEGRRIRDEPNRQCLDPAGTDSSSILHPSSFLPKIADFGLAKEWSGDLERTARTAPTRAGHVLGTPSYMAPEQVGRSGQPVGPCVDVYALGAILYELLTGRPPFQAQSPFDTILQVIHEDPPPVMNLCPALPRDLATITLKCLEKRPDRRYATAHDLALDLRRFLDNQPIKGRPPSALDRWGKFARRNMVLVGGAACVLAALVLGIVATSIFALAESEQRKLADNNAQEAEKARSEALMQAYRARLAAALAALRDHDIGEASRQLEESPPGLRGWEWRHVRSQLDDSLAVVHGLVQHENSAGFCWPGQRLVAAVDGAGVCLLNTENGNNLHDLAMGPHEVFIVHTRHGPLIFLHDRATGLRLVDADGRQRTSFATLVHGRPMALAVNPEGTRLAVYSYQESASILSIIDLASASPAVRFAIKTNWIYGLAFTPDGRAIASAEHDTMVRLRNAETGAETKVFHGHTGVVRSVAFSPDGKRMVSSGDDQTIRQWDVTNQEMLDVRQGHIESVLSVAFSPDGRWIASGGEDGTVRIWRTDGGPASAVLHGHTSGVYRVEFGPDGTKITTVSKDGTARIWDTTSPDKCRVLRVHESYVYAVACSPDGRWIASAGWDQTIRLWDAHSGEQVASLKGHHSWIAALAFNPEGSRLVSRGNDATLRIWNTATGECLAVLPQGGIQGPHCVHNLAISPNGRTIACGLDNQVRFIDLETAKEQRLLSLPTERISIVAFSADGLRMAAAGGGNAICIVDLDTNQITTVEDGHHSNVNSIAFSPDGTRLVSAADTTVRLWDVRTGELKAVLRGHTGEVFSAIFHPDGKRIASGGRDRLIHIWDTETGAEMARLQGHTSYIFSMAFSPDGATLVSGSGDYTVRLWDTFPVTERLKARRERKALQAADHGLAEFGSPN